MATSLLTPPFSLLLLEIDDNSMNIVFHILVSSNRVDRGIEYCPIILSCSVPKWVVVLRSFDCEVHRREGFVDHSTRYRYKYWNTREDVVRWPPMAQWPRALVHLHVPTSSLPLRGEQMNNGKGSD